MYAPEGRLTVQGNAIVRVEPDLASITFAVSQTGPTPSDAFANVRETSEKVRAFLQGATSSQVRSSRIALSQQTPRLNEGPKEIGYLATANFSIVVSDLEAMEGLLSGVVAAGANRLTSVQFLTSKLKEVRDEVRKMAVVAAKEKAQLLCETAGVQLGPIIGLMEGHFDPDRRPGGHVSSSAPTTDVDAKVGTFSPGSIPVGASVTLSFKLL